MLASAMSVATIDYSNQHRHRHLSMRVTLFGVGLICKGQTGRGGCGAARAANHNTIAARCTNVLLCCDSSVTAPRSLTTSIERRLVHSLYYALALMAWQTQEDARYKQSSLQSSLRRPITPASNGGGVMLLMRLPH